MHASAITALRRIRNSSEPFKSIEPGFAFHDNEHNLRFAARMAELGLSTALVQGTWWNAGRYPLNPGMDSVSMDGKPVVARPLGAVGGTEIGGVRWAIE